MPSPRRRKLLLGASVALLGALAYAWQLTGFTPRLPWPQLYHLSLAASQVQGRPPGIIFIPDDNESPPVIPVVVTAAIVGGIDHAPGLVCQNSTWDFGDGTGATEMRLCSPWWSGGQVPRRIQRGHGYERPGTYVVTFSYGWLRSEPVTLEVK